MTHLEALIRLSCDSLDDLPSDHEAGIGVHDSIALAFTGLCGDRAEGAALVAQKMRELDALTIAFRRTLEEAPQSPPEHHSRLGTISTEDAAHNAEQFHEADGGGPMPFAAVSERDWQEYLAGCAEWGRAPLTLAQFRPVAAKALHEGWTPGQTADALRRAEDARAASLAQISIR